MGTGDVGVIEISAENCVCYVMSSSGELPAGLRKLRDLEELILSDNKLEGEGIASILRFRTAYRVSSIPFCLALVERRVIR